MVRLGDKVTIVESDSGTIATIGGKAIGIGKRILSLPADGLPIAVRQFNTYKGDDGVSLPLPCGTRAFVASEPPNYLPASWESGFPLAATQGAATTKGWSCSSGCPINPTYHPTASETCRRAYGLSLPWLDAGACTHASGAGSWRYNKYWHWDGTAYYYGCKSQCYQNYQESGGGTYKVYCKYYQTETVKVKYTAGGETGGPAFAGCYKSSNRYIKRTWQFAVLNGTLVDTFYSYACNGPNTVCPLYNGGSGTKFPVCTIKSASAIGPPDNFPTPSKPSGCKHHDQISFLGWVIPGSTKTESASCVLAKATEGAANRSEGPIRCTFSYPTGSATLTGQGDLRLPLSPTNLEGDGKAGTPLSASAAISVGGETNMDYTRYPTLKTNSGIACAFSQGRY